jgi:hypothetical protein
MSTPAQTHRVPATPTASRTGMELNDWVFVAWTLTAAALLLWLTNQAVHVALTHGGPQYVCATRKMPDSARALGASDLGPIAGESTFFPPTFVCSYPHQDGVQPWIVVDMYPAGPWIFWSALVMLILTTVLAFVLRRRARL